jgi:protein-S-isoprenylcysteine O-methyltransferase Ste14
MSRLELKVIPDVAALVVAGLMWFVAGVTPALAAFGPVWLLVSFALLVVGSWLIVAARVEFSRGGTTFDPTAPGAASHLVTGGVYRFTRNPMYLGTFLILLAVGALLVNVFSFVVSAAFAVYIDRFQIEPEERALRAKFGPAYDEYAARVRRWT